MSGTPLWELAEKLADPLLFPLEVHELYAAGKVDAARDLLAKSMKAEKDPERRTHQRRALDDPWLWLEPMESNPTMFRFNGIGTAVYGRHRADAVGRYITTLWFTFVFLPVFPLGAYVVKDAPEGGWYFLARAPLPPFARGMRLFTPAAVAVGVAAAFVAMIHAARYDVVVVYNGYDRPIEVAIGSEIRAVEPHGHVTVKGLPIGPTMFAATAGGREIERFEADLPGGSSTVLYNVRGRGTVSHDYVRYGVGEAPEGALLAPQALHILDSIDYAFVDPPYSKKVAAGSHIQDDLLVAYDHEMALARCVYAHLGAHGTEAALAVLRAELDVNPDRIEAVDLALRLLGDDPDAAAALLADLVARAPTSTALHRTWQDYRRVAHGSELVDEYRLLAEQNPDSAMHQYLYGRLLDDDQDAADVLFRRAIALDPDFGYGWLGLGYGLAVRDRVGEASDAYARFGRAMPTEAAAATRTRGRLARLAGTNPEVVLTDIEQVAGPTFAVDAMRLQLATAAEPARLAEHLVAAAAVGARFHPESGVATTVLGIDLCRAAGDRSCVGAKLGDVGELDPAWVASVALWSALADDAAPGDLAAALDTHGEGLTAPYNALVAHGAAVRAGHPSAAALRDRVLSDHSVFGGRGALLAQGVDPADPAAVRALVATLHPDERAPTLLAASLLAEAAGAKGNVWRSYREEAARYALPGEVPVWR